MQGTEPAARLGRIRSRVLRLARGAGGMPRRDGGIRFALRLYFRGAINTNVRAIRCGEIDWPAIVTFSNGLHASRPAMVTGTWSISPQYVLSSFESETRIPHPAPPSTIQSRSKV